MSAIYKSEKEKLLDLLNSIDPKSTEYIEFTPQEYVKLKKEINLMGGKIKLTIIPPPKSKS